METSYSNLTKEQLEIVNEYCDHDMKKLKGICYMVWGKSNIPIMHHDDLYSDAMKVLLESVITFSDNKNTKFRTYLTNNIKLSFGEWFRNNNLRSKRSNLELDKNGKIKKDENGNPIIIKNVSIDMSIGDSENSTIGDMIADKNTIDKILFGEKEDTYSKEMQEYLSRLSKLQKQVLYLISIGYLANEIIEKLHISKKDYDDCYLAIHSCRNTKILL